MFNVAANLPTLESSDDMDPKIIDCARSMDTSYNGVFVSQLFNVEAENSV